MGNQQGKVENSNDEQNKSHSIDVKLEPLPKMDNDENKNKTRKISFLNVDFRKNLLRNSTELSIDASLFHRNFLDRNSPLSLNNLPNVLLQKSIALEYVDVPENMVKFLAFDKHILEWSLYFKN